MKKAEVYVDGVLAGELQEEKRGQSYIFTYLPEYSGPSVSLEMPLSKSPYLFDRFPPFFEGLLPEGVMLDGLLRQTKLDKNDFLGQLIVVGKDLVGNVTIEGVE